MGRLSNAVWLLLLSGCSAERAVGPQLVTELLPVRPGCRQVELTSILNQQPLLSDSLGQVFQWKPTVGGRIRLEAYGSQRIVSVVSNFVPAAEDSCWYLYQALERELRRRLGPPTSGQSGNYNWSNSTDSTVWNLRLLPDKKRLTLQVFRVSSL